MARLTKITGKNFLKLVAVDVDIDPSSSMTVIGGRNGQGKTAVLRIVKALLGGAREAPDKPLREGSGRGKIAIEIGDVVEIGGLRFERGITEKGLGQLKITGADGSVHSSPQSIANRFKCDLTFDPMHFDRLVRYSPKEAAETLRAMVGVDTSSLEGQLADLVERRRDAKRQLLQTQTQLHHREWHDDAPDQLIRVDHLIDELRDRNASESAAKHKRRQFEDVYRSCSVLEHTIHELQKSIRLKQEQLAKRRIELQSLRTEIDTMSVKDPEEIHKALKTADVSNQKFRENQEYLKLQQEKERYRNRYNGLDEQVNNVRKLIGTTTKSASYPVDGLEVTSDGVELDGLPWSQASTSRRIRASTAIGFAQHPELKLLLVEDGAYLDRDNLALLSDLAEEAGGMVLVEVVGEGEQCHVVIEDGEIKS